MRVRRIAEGNLISRGNTFKNSEYVEVNLDTFNYLKKFFPNDFEFYNDKPKTVKKDIVEDKIKTPTEPKIKPVASRRKKGK